MVSFCVRVFKMMSADVPKFTHGLHLQYYSSTSSSELVHFIYGFWDHVSMNESQKQVIKSWSDAGVCCRVWNYQECISLSKRNCLREFDVSDIDLSPIQFADLARLMILYVHGGWYADLDARYVGPHPLKTARIIDTHRTRKEKNIGVALCETTLTEKQAKQIGKMYYIRDGVPEHTTRIANYAMYAPPRSAWIRRALLIAKHRLMITQHKKQYVVDPSLDIELSSELNITDKFQQAQYNVLYTTGPDVITTATFDHSDEFGATNPVMDTPRNDVCVVPNITDLVIHYSRGSWRNKKVLKSNIDH